MADLTGMLQATAGFQSGGGLGGATIWELASATKFNEDDQSQRVVFVNSDSDVVVTIAGGDSLTGLTGSDYNTAYMKFSSDGSVSSYYINGDGEARWQSVALHGDNIIVGASQKSGNGDYYVRSIDTSANSINWARQWEFPESTDCYGVVASDESQSNYYFHAMDPANNLSSYVKFDPADFSFPATGKRTQSNQTPQAYTGALGSSLFVATQSGGTYLYVSGPRFSSNLGILYNKQLFQSFAANFSTRNDPYYHIGDDARKGQFFQVGNDVWAVCDFVVDLTGSDAKQRMIKFASGTSTPDMETTQYVLNYTGGVQTGDAAVPVSAKDGDPSNIFSDVSNEMMYMTFCRNASSESGYYEIAKIDFSTGTPAIDSVLKVSGLRTSANTQSRSSALRKVTYDSQDYLAVYSDSDQNDFNAHLLLIPTTISDMDGVETTELTSNLTFTDTTSDWEITTRTEDFSSFSTGLFANGNPLVSEAESASVSSGNDLTNNFEQ